MPSLPYQSSSSSAVPIRKPRRKKRAIILTGCLIWGSLVAVPSLVAQTTWTGATNTNWFTNTNWDTNVVPNGITLDVIVGAPSTTNVNGNVNINSLNVGAAGILTLNANLSFDFGGTAATTLINAGTINTLNNSTFQLARTVNNSGSINVTNTGNLTDLEVIADGAILTGGGTITLGTGVNSNNNSRIVGVAGSPTLTIGNQTIQGFGQIGANTLVINNQVNGLIHANSSGRLLTIDPSAGGMTNAGTMRASGGGALELTGNGGGSFNNAGGLVEAQNGSAVQLSNATISGGTVASSGSGQITVDGSSNTFLQNLTLAGNVQTFNNSDLGITGSINNTGSITVNNTGNLTDIEVQAGGATLTGGGTITLQGTTNASRIDGVAGSPTLRIVNQTIQGFGNIGNNTIGIINQTGNLIHANSNAVGSLLTIDPSNVGNMINQGTMRASGGGILQLAGNGGGNFNNAGGLIEAQTGSTVRLTNATVVGGTLSSSGTGLFSVDSSSNSFLENLMFSGNMEVQNNSDLGITGTITNTGSITVNTTGFQTDIEIQSGGATLTGGGTITLQGTTNASRIDGVAGSPTLTIANQTIQGFGNIGNNTIGIINQTGNLIHANSNAASSILTIDPSAVGNMTNQGTIRASNGGTLQLAGNGGGSFNNAGGLIEAQTGSTVRLTNATVVGGTLSSSGTGLFSVDSSSNSFLENLTLSGNMEVQNNTDLGITGTITNTGSITVNTTGFQTDIEIQSGGATLAGGGMITLQGTTSASRIDGVAGSPTLTIADQTIQGFGNVGTNTLGILNGANGVIHANAGTTLTVDPSNAGNFVNQGTLRASNNTQLLLTGSGGGNFSGDGVYEAIGGFLRSDSTAQMNSFSGGVITEGTWRAIAGSGTAIIQLDSLAIVPPTAIGTNAAVELSGVNSQFSFNAANNPIDNSLNSVQGSLTLRDGRVMNLAGGLSNSGSILIDGSTLGAGSYTQTGGSLTLDNGIMNMVGVTNQATAGLVAGNGTINGDFTFTGTAKLDPGFSPGQLNFGDDLTWGAGGSILFDLGIDQLSSDLIDVTGNLLKSGAGSFEFTFVDNGWVVGNTYDLIQYNSTTFNLADFSFTNTGGFNGNFAFSGGNTLQFTVTSAIPEPGSAIVFAVAGLLMVSRRRRD